MGQNLTVARDESTIPAGRGYHCWVMIQQHLHVRSSRLFIRAASPTLEPCPHVHVHRGVHQGHHSVHWRQHTTGTGPVTVAAQYTRAQRDADNFDWLRHSALPNASPSEHEGRQARAPLRLGAGSFAAAANGGACTAVPLPSCIRARGHRQAPSRRPSRADPRAHMPPHSWCVHCRAPHQHGLYFCRPLEPSCFQL